MAFQLVMCKVTKFKSISFSFLFVCTFILCIFCVCILSCPTSSKDLALKPGVGVTVCYFDIFSVFFIGNVSNFFKLFSFIFVYFMHCI